MALPRILVIDDRLGRIQSTGRNEERRKFCKTNGLNDVTTGSAAVTDEPFRSPSPIADAVFCRGQTPAVSPPGTHVENDLQQCLEVIRAGWDHSTIGECWTLLLLDMHFGTGVVLKGSSELPKGCDADRDPENYFGMEILDAIDREEPLNDLPIVILSSMAQDQIEERFAHRAFEFIDTLDDKTIRTDAAKITAKQRLKLCIHEHGLIPAITPADGSNPIVGTSLPLLRTLKLARRLAGRNEPILIEGETGTGKESLAWYIHDQHPDRRLRSYVTLNCGGFSRDIWISELFGHKKGAYTSAVRDRQGKIEEAAGGDLFLDEVGNMPVDVQDGLLRVIDNGRVVPFGGAESDAIENVDVRFICATNSDLEQLEAHGHFKHDMIYRLTRGGRIQIPPLRERRTDIPLLVEHVINVVKQREGSDSPEWRLTEKAMEKLRDYYWPGNIRELYTVVSRALYRVPRLNCVSDRLIEFDRANRTVVTSNGGQQKIDPNRTMQWRSPLEDYEIKDVFYENAEVRISRAVHRRLENTVAIRQIKLPELAELDPEAAEEKMDQMKAEAKTAAKLLHPGIVRIHNCGEDRKGSFFFAMDYIEGGNLLQHLQRQNGQRIPLRDAARMLLEITEAIEYAHGMSVVHLDLTPRNILIDRDGRHYVTDFEYCRQLRSSDGVARRGTDAGTMNYMPPEQTGSHPGKRGVWSDIYSLGAILYRAITGTPPVGEDNQSEITEEEFMELEHQLCHELPAAPSSLNPSVDSQLEQICLRCLEKNPTQRYQRAGDLATALREYIGQTINARSIVDELSQRSYAAFSEAAESINLETVTAATASLLLGYLHSRIPPSKSDRKGIVLDIFEGLAGGRNANTCGTKAAQLLTGLLHSAPSHTRRAILSSERLVWLASKVLSRNQTVRRELLGGVCFLQRLKSSDVETLINESKTEALLHSEKLRDEETIADLDYSWHIISEIIAYVVSGGKQPGFPIAGGDEVPASKIRIDNALPPSRLLSPEQIQSIANALDARNGDVFGNGELDVGEWIPQVDAETEAYYRFHYSQLESLIESASSAGESLLVFYR